MQLCDYVIRDMMSCSRRVLHQQTVCDVSWRVTCSVRETTQKCCEGCGLATNRDVNAATNILNALRSLGNGGRTCGTPRPTSQGKMQPMTAMTLTRTARTARTTMTVVMIVKVRVSERSTQVRLVAPTLPLSVLQMWTIGMTACWW
jgi:hypothetical protein